jgi:hypothetical protein
MMIHITCRYWRGGVLVVPHGPPDTGARVAVGVGLDEVGLDEVGLDEVGLDEGEGVVWVPPC